MHWKVSFLNHSSRLTCLCFTEIPLKSANIQDLAQLFASRGETDCKIRCFFDTVLSFLLFPGAQQQQTGDAAQLP